MSTKAFFKKASPYQDDAMNLPVEDLDQVIPFYETVMGFQVEARQNTPHKSAVLSRDEVQIGLAENGGDPSNDGCFFEVDDVEVAFSELKANGLHREEADYQVDEPYVLFFIIAPDGLCYCIGERRES